MPRTAEPKLTKKAAAQAFVRAQGWRALGTAEWDALRTAFPETSASTLVTALAEADVPLAQPYAGVHTKTWDVLEDSLRELARVYLEARQAQMPNVELACRGAVIAAKDRTRFASRNPKSTQERRARKAEMVEWMLVWLGDPAVFSTWVTLRKRARTY